KTGPHSWSIDTAGDRLPAGTSYWTFYYEGNIIKSGKLGKTSNPELGDFYFFDWAPVQWSTALKYRNVKIVLPFEVKGETLNEAEFEYFAGYSRQGGMDQQGSEKARIFTEDYMNQRYKIDYLGTFVDGKYLLTMQVYQENVPREGAQRIQFYMRPDTFKFDESAVAIMQSENANDDFGSNGTSEDEAFSKVLLTFLGFFGICGVGFGFATASGNKARANVVQKPTYASNLANELWEPPKLEVGSFMVKGKINKNLHPIEVGLLLGLQLSQVANIIVDAMVDEEKARIICTAPLTIEAVPGAVLTQLESDFMDTLMFDGTFAQDKLTKFLENVIAQLQEKIWDCDVEAMKAYYLEVYFDGVAPEAASSSVVNEVRENAYEKRRISDRDFGNSRGWSDDEWRYRRYWYHMDAHYRHRATHVYVFPASLNTTYSGFMDSSACFHGCFEQPNIDINVCHSACHSACHDACHSACHSACHHACHSACHSACVSGGGH
ncbi:MAG: hypothetical protein II180_02020, partial [Proteobacteria bacterium]|nr:hypothetical protein [Pseudomonadota bacterium]